MKKQGSSTVKRLFGIVFTMLAIALQAHLYADEAVLQAFINTRDTNTNLTLGRTRSDLTQCIEWAEKLGVPLVGIWSNEGCAHCERLERAMSSEAYLAHAKKSGLIICAVFNSDGKGSITESDPDGVRNGPGYHWCWGQGGGSYKSVSTFPFVRFYWKKGGKTLVDTVRTGDQVDGNIGTDASSGTTTDEFGTYTSVAGKTANKAGLYTIEYMRKMFPGYEPVVIDTFSGGTFADPDTDGNRLEFEGGTSVVKVNLAREQVDATNVTFVVAGPSGAQLKSEKINWAAGETNKTVEVELTAAMKSACKADGQQLTLYLADKDKYMATNHITFVDREPSAANPLWIGEREDLEFGEWTMDLDLAKQVVKNASGDAFTLVSIQGSMWCPDCANTDRNFLEVKDGSGNNRFAAWAKSKNVALVSMDIPNYNQSGSTVEKVASPTLFSRKEFETTLARAKEYPASGAEEALTKPIKRSGLGYMTRKGVTDEQGAAVMEKFRTLAVTNTDKGGFHRPEDTNAYRTGVPIFVLLRKDGSVAARFTRFAAVSPMKADQSNFDNYIKRFDEMLAVAASSGSHKDAKEIENNYPGEGAVSFAANGGTASGELCNADFQDAFKLTGVGGNADQKVTVKGDSSAQVSVQFWQKAADGSFKALGTAATGSLSAGVDLTQSFTEAGDYYLLVKGSDITSAEFNAGSSTANHFIAYEVRGSAVLVPQEDRVTANAPAGSDVVTVRLATDTVYCFTGVKAEDNPSLVQIADASPFRFMKSTVAGDVDLKISSGFGGEITYQIWNPGQIGFVETERTVPESINDLDDDWVEFTINRTGGKSGRVKARVTVDLEKSTLLPDRYVFMTNAINAADFVWEDGVTSNMTVQVKIIDDEFYDGDFKLVFNLEVLASDAGDVSVIEDADVFTLNITEDDKNVPGRALISGTTPECAGKTVYVCESEGAKVWVERIEASSGLVKVRISSTVEGTTFETENPRDMTNEYDRTYIYWSSREMGSKYVKVGNIPAGKSAKIELLEEFHNNFKVVSTSRWVNVVSVADDAPRFAEKSGEFVLYRYLESGSDTKVALDAAFINGGNVSFTKRSGTLPAGLKAVYDEESKSLIFTGTVTAKPGVYPVSYQVFEVRSGKKVPGLTTMVTLEVKDPTDPVTYPEGANPAAQVTRTLKDIAIVDPVTKRLAGVLQLTIPKKGNVSGKYVSEAGTVSLTAKSWSEYDPGTCALTAEIANAAKKIKATVIANADYSVKVLLDDDGIESTLLDGYCDGQHWSAEVAPDWAGYYTVALPVEGVVSNVTAYLPPTGDGYLTLRMDSKTMIKSATFKWAGILPNGVAVSGSSVLGAPYAGKSAIEEQCNWANLPIFRKSSTDVLSVYLKIRDLAATDEIKGSDRRVIWPVDDVVSYMRHGDRKSTATDYMVNLGAYGSIYDKTENLGACCLEFYQTQEMLLGFDTHYLVWTAFGEPQAVPPVKVTITESALYADADDLKAAGATMSFNRSTGVISGSVRLNCSDKSVGAKYKGVVLTGWGESCCGISAGLKAMPLINGAFFYTDKVEDGKRKISVKRGGLASVDVQVD